MKQTYSVSEITKYIKNLLADDNTLHNVAITGEISNFKRYSSENCYFTLKDSGAQLKCILFKWNARQLAFQPENGAKVLAIGHIAVYERDGVYQLYVDILQKQGLGELMLAYERLKKQLEKEGLFAVERKRPLPMHPRVIGIVTSPSGAAVRDIITVSRRRCPGIKLLLFPSQVQGENAAAEITRAIEFFNRTRLADLLIVGRGGGSFEDLYAFNDETLVRTVAASEIPIISAVGHENDFCLCDFAADKRAATPSQAAELAVPDTQNLLTRLDQLTKRCRYIFYNQWQQTEEHFQELATFRSFQHPEQIFEGFAQRLDRSSQQIYDQLRLQEQLKEQRFCVAVAKLEGLSPLAVLARGYSVTSCEGKLVRSVDEVAWGAEITTQLGDGGKIISVVQSTES